MNGAGATVLSTRKIKMKEHPAHAGIIRRAASTAQMPPRHLLVDKLVIQAGADKTRRRRAANAGFPMPIR